jgi:hypothetical protein
MNREKTSNRFGWIAAFSAVTARLLPRGIHAPRLSPKGQADEQDLFAVLTNVKKFIAREVPAILGLHVNTPVRAELPLKGRARKGPFKRISGKS